MPDFAVATVFTARDRVSGVFKEMGKNAFNFSNRMKDAMHQASRSSTRFGDIVKGVFSARMLERAIFGIKDFAIETKDAAKSQQAMKTAFASVFAGDAVTQMDFVSIESKRLGLNLESTAKSYMSIAAAAKGSTISNDQVKDVFLGVSEAATSLQLSSEQTEGALVALSQMISKGKVQAEELRGQLGERIPGAFQIAARAMGMTTAQLDKFMSTGQLTSEIFIPKFAQQLRKEFGASATNAANSFAAAENRFSTSMYLFKASMGSVLLPLLIRVYDVISDMLIPIQSWVTANKELITQSLIDWFTTIKDIGSMFIPIIKAIWKMFSLLNPILKILAPILPVIAIGFLANAIAMRAIMIVKLIIGFLSAIKVIRSAGFAMWFFNAACAANPINLIIFGVTALAAALVLVIYNWKTIWEWIKKIAMHPIFLTLATIFFPFVGIPLVIAKNWKPIIALFGQIGDKIAYAKKVAMEFLGINSGSELSAPNKSEIKSRRMIDFRGRLDIANAPNGSEARGYTRGAPQIKINMLGKNV